MTPYHLRLPALAAAVLVLSACSDGPSPLAEPLRAGADRQAVVTKGLPPGPSARNYDPGIAPENEARGVKVGELVTGKGGQQAQKEAEKKAQTDLEAKQARERAELTRQQRSDERTTVTPE